MKKFLLALLPCLSLVALEIPESITITGKDIEVRLDAAKRWNINSIKYKGEVIGVDNSGFHYGMTYMKRNAKGFVGSGHIETGDVEKVKSIRFFITDQEVKPAEKMNAKNGFHMEKVSDIGDFEVTYTLNIENNIIHERIKLVAVNKAQLAIVYCFMHPWSPKFTDFFGIKPDGSEVFIKLKSDEKFPSTAFLPKIALLDPQTGTALATEVLMERRWSSSAKRLLWDRNCYHKDYVVPFSNTTLAKGHTSELSSRTVFFTTTAEKFAEDSKKIFLLN